MEDKEDFLEVDPKIPGQNYVCLSFVSPDKLIKQKEIYFAQKFLEYIINDQDMMVQKIRENMLNSEIKINYENVNQLYDDWKYSRTEELETDFFEICDYKTTMRGIKVRGTYDTYKEAKIRAEVLRRKDPSFNVFVGQVGYWLPWDPDSHTVQEQEYQEGQLNDLVKKYKENLNNRDIHYDQVKNEKIEKARKEIEAKKETIKAQNSEIKVPESNIEEESKTIENLRNIVDESDKLYYSNLEKNSNNVEETSNEEIVSKAEETLEKVSEQVSSEEVNNFNIPSMENLENEDPWMKNKRI
jgi:hypothetical protein